MFSNLTNKDEFLNQYTIYLSRRLLSLVDTNYDTERNILSRIRKRYSPYTIFYSLVQVWPLWVQWTVLSTMWRTTQNSSILLSFSFIAYYYRTLMLLLLMNMNSLSMFFPKDSGLLYLKPSMKIWNKLVMFIAPRICRWWLM